MADIVTTGGGHIERIADQADLALAWRGHGRDRASAVDDLGRSIADVEPLLARDGVRVLSRQLSVHDRWHTGRRRDGADAAQSYRIRVTDLSLLDDLLAVIVASEPSDVQGPYWGLADDTESVREARHAAVADARTKARTYAEAVGGRLGAIVRVADESHFGHGMPMFATSARSAQAGMPDVAELNLEPQPVTVAAQCTITWELLVS
jgi:uncharacterized protein